MPPLKAVLRGVLRRVGLLPLARWSKQTGIVLRAAPRNRRFRSGWSGPLPLPPARLVLRVAGTPELEWYVASGHLAADSIRDLLAANGIRMEGLERLLDFGCGCGRVARHWSELPARIHGTDLDPELARWCRVHLPFGEFRTNGLKPPTDQEAGSFDLVYALSVFTHLPEELQGPWIAELHRILRPGGHLVLSTHGERYLAELSEPEQGRFRRGELVVRRSEEPGSNLCAVYHPESWVRDVLARGFRVVSRVPEGALGNPHQDLYLLARV